MEIIEILAIIFAVLFVAMGLAFIGAKNKHEQASAERDKYRKDYSRMLEEQDGTYQDKKKMEIAWAKAEREYRELDAVWLQQIERIRRQQSQIDALTELWRHSAARAFDLDEECTANRILYERTANERDGLNRKWHADQSALIVVNLARIEEQARWDRDMKLLSAAQFQQVISDATIERLETDLAGTRETLLSVGNVSEERQQRIQAYEQQQRVSDGNVQRLEAERDEALGNVRADIQLQADFNAIRDSYNNVLAYANSTRLDMLTQRRHNDTLNAVQARLMRERDEAVADWVQELGLREGWEQTAGELEWETRRLQTALEVQQNAVTRLDAQLVRARANDTGRDPQTGQFVKRGKK